jgi:hypothetical protein
MTARLLLLKTFALVYPLLFSAKIWAFFQLKKMWLVGGIPKNELFDNQNTYKEDSGKVLIKGGTANANLNNKATANRMIWCEWGWTWDGVIALVYFQVIVCQL